MQEENKRFRKGDKKSGYRHGCVHTQGNGGQTISPWQGDVRQELAAP
jgi:hypothetical protein